MPGCESRYMAAAVKALDHFPVVAEKMRLIGQSENVTFRIRARGSGTDYALRLHRPGYNSIEELNSERLWTRALKQGGVAVPGSLRTHEGQHFAPVDIPDTQERRYAGITTWLAGPPLNEYLASCTDAAERKRIFYRIGGIAAAIHDQSTAWQEPPGFRRRQLDLDGLLGDMPHWGRFWEHAELTIAERALLLRLRESARAALSAYGASAENFSLIHSDLHPHNIVCTGDDLALIDFDDAAYGWHLYDLASALIEDRFSPDFAALRAALLEGYRARRPLAQRDVEMLPTFLVVRGLAIVGWFHQRAEHTGSKYFDQIRKMVVDAAVKLREPASDGFP